MESLIKIKNFALDTLFPISCLNCGLPDTWLCPECLAKIPALSSQVCPYCEKITTSSGRICSKCRDGFLTKNKKAPLDALVCATRYKEGNISKLIHLYKYNFVSDLRQPLGKIMIRGILENNLPLPDVIIPIPLHPRRLRWRGFNQSELLANYIAQNLTPGFPIPILSNFIIRARYTRPQMKIKDYKERQKNISGIFTLAKGSTSSDHNDRGRLNLQAIKDKNILLIDDVATTGATLFECAKVLKANGAKKVFGIVIARQEIKIK